MRPPIVQQHPFGCAVACVAYALDVPYGKALRLFRDGEQHAKSRGFYCKEIVAALEKAGKNYGYRYVSARVKKKNYGNNTIVFTRRSKKYPAGHYLCQTKNLWMDPWINFPQNKNIKYAKSGLRKRLPNKPIYAITTH